MKVAMKKSDLIKLTADQCGLAENKARYIVNTITDIIMNELSRGGSINLDGFGKFYTKAYVGRNITTPTGESIYIPYRQSPRFRPSVKLKERCKTGSPAI